MLPLLLLGGAGLASGYLKGKRNEKMQEENAKFRKAAIQYSPWTHMSDPGAGPQGPGALEAAIGGGMQGAAMGSLIGNAAAPAAAAPAVENPVAEQQLGATGPVMASPGMDAMGTGLQSPGFGRKGMAWQLMQQNMNPDGINS